MRFKSTLHHWRVNLNLFWFILSAFIFTSLLSLPLDAIPVSAVAAAYHRWHIFLSRRCCLPSTSEHVSFLVVMWRAQVNARQIHSLLLCDDAHWNSLEIMIMQMKGDYDRKVNAKGRLMYRRITRSKHTRSSMIDEIQEGKWKLNLRNEYVST